MARNIRMRLKRLEGGPGILVMSRHSGEVAIGQGAVQQLSFGLNGETVADVFIGDHVLANPLTMIRVSAVASGDALNVCWRSRQKSLAQVVATVR